MLTKTHAISLFGSRKKLQTALGLKSHASILMWGENIPQHHELRIRYELMPEAFNKDGSVKKSFLPKQAKAA